MEEPMDKTMESGATGTTITCEIARLPEELISASIALTGPVSACLAAVVSPTFRVAADSDAVWACFLPRDLPPLADGELSPPPPSKKALFMRLSASPVLLADGLTSMWLDRKTGTKCYMLPAKNLSLSWCYSPTGMGWMPVNDSRTFPEGAGLSAWLDLQVSGKINSKMLSKHTTYNAYLVLAVHDLCYGFHYAFHEGSASLEENMSRSDIYIYGNGYVGPWKMARGGISMASGAIVLGDREQFSNQSADGWLEMEMCEFHNGEGEDKEIEIGFEGRLLVGSNLIVLGIEIVAKKEGA